MEQPKKEEEEDNLTLILSLFDSNWSHHLILFKPPPPPPPSPPPPPPPPPPPTTLPDLPRHRHIRSLSDFDLSIAPPLPSLRLSAPKLQTILSGKVSDPPDGAHSAPSTAATKSSMRRTKRNRKSRISKSMTELEFEELKGFMDLGFTFAEAEADPRLMSIVPGLQRLKDPLAAEEPARPYLSEAWDAGTEDPDPLRNWRIPAVAEGIDLKDHLRFWAHTVASTVR